MINDMIINVTRNYIKNKNKSIESNQTIGSSNKKYDKNKSKNNKNKSYKNQLTPNNTNFRIKSKIQNINDKRNDFNYKNKTESNATENNNNKFEKSSYKTLIINSPESINSNKTIRINKKLSLSDKNIIENLNELEPKYLSPNSTRKCKTNKRYKNNFNKNNKLNIIISPLRTSTDKVLTHRRNYESNLSDFENNNFNINEKTENYRIRIKRAKKKENEKMILLAEELNQKRKEEIYNKLKEEEEKFNEELKSIDNISLLNSPIYKTIDKNNNFKEKGMIGQIADKLIKSTIFSKYLIEKKKKNNNVLKADLENKFYILQKYKNIIGIIERMRNRIFTKKMNDFNFYTFDEYLNDDNDKKFTK